MDTLDMRSVNLEAVAQIFVCVVKAKKLDNGGRF